MGGIDGQAKYLGDLNHVYKYVDADLHHEDEDRVVEGKGLYNQMYSSEEF